MVEKFSYSKKINDVIMMLKNCDKYLLENEKQEVLQNLLLKSSQLFIQSGFPLKDIETLLITFRDIDLEFETFLQNKILDIINKN